MQYADYKKIPNKLRKCRLAAGLNRELVAKILGLKYTGNICRWEAGETLPSLLTAFKLAGLYKVYVDELFFDLMQSIRSEVTSRADEISNQKAHVIHK